MFTIIPGGETDRFYSTDDPLAETRIGHVRFDFGCGNEFWTTWWPGCANDEHNTEAFRAELSSVVDFLRKDILQSAQMASKMVGKLKLPSIDDDHRYYGCHILTSLHAYYLRLYPGTGDYSYLYCYRREPADCNES